MNTLLVILSYPRALLFLEIFDDVVDHSRLNFGKKLLTIIDKREIGGGGVRRRWQCMVSGKRFSMNLV